MSVSQFGVNLRTLSSSFTQAVPLANQRYSVTKLSSVPKSALVALSISSQSDITPKRMGTLSFV